MNKLKRTPNFKSSSSLGFTLIELLIVVVIIGILAVVLITVVNPVRVQNRTRNTTIKTAINKVGFGVNTTRAGTGRLPSDTEFPVELENITVNACNSAINLDCNFSFGGLMMPSTCGGDGVTGDGANLCYLRVFSTTPNDLIIGKFRIVGKKYKLAQTDAAEIFVFDSSAGLYTCPADFSGDGALPNTCVKATD